MKIKVRKQMPDTPPIRNAMKNASSMGSVSMVFLVLAIALSFVGSGNGKKYYMWYIRGTQIVCHLPMLSVLVPANVS